jgi:hypothetical protein
MRTAVLGGGLQGACAALELASSGISVDLYDRNDCCLTQASFCNEGKIHLGYVYANDTTLNTARTLIKGALNFMPLIRKWLGSGVDTIPISTPFHYAVHDSSLLSVRQVADYFECCHRIALEESRGHLGDYFGSDYRKPATLLSEKERSVLFDCSSTKAVFRTPEIAIDPEALAGLVRARLAADPKIQFLGRAFVRSVTPGDRSLEVEFEQSGGIEKAKYDHVVNALWEGRLAVDLTAGLPPERPWLYRLKHYLRMSAPGIASRIPSTTIVLGPFGDVVRFESGLLYLSWYPQGLRGFSTDISPPAWQGQLDTQTALEMQAGILSGLASVVPSVERLSGNAVDSCQVKAGVIFAWGTTDITDRASGLHERSAIGVRSRGGLHSVDTGKLTMAPLFGTVVADRIRGMV